MDRRLGATSLLCSTYRETRAGCAFVLPLASAASLSSSLLCSSIHHPQLGTSTLHPDAMAAPPFHSLGIWLYSIVSCASFQGVGIRRV
jgi:hypothetical protein